MSVYETAKERDARLALERKTCELANVLKEQLPGAEVGFALFLFDCGPGGAMAYVSNAQRDDFRKALREFLERWDRGTV